MRKAGSTPATMSKQQATKLPVAYFLRQCCFGIVASVDRA